MKRLMYWLLFTSLSFAGATIAAAAEVKSADVEKAIAHFKSKDPSMEGRFKSAYGYAVFPSVGKGGLIVGGAAGDGQVFERGKPIGTASISMITVGVQAGVQTFMEVIFFENKAALDRFTANKYEFAANASAVIAKAGASASNNYRNGVLVFTSSEEGVMAEAAVGGQRFKFQRAK